jgi:DHA2 family multidrug resistance protein-like MFS transporter
VLAVCCVAAALLGIDNSVLNYAIPSLSRQLDPSSTQMLWIVDTYGLVLGSLLIVAGTLGDRIGRRRLLLAGVAGFGAASALTAYATSPGMLIAGRALLGVAGATIMPSTISLLRSAFTDPKERATAVGVSSGVAAASFALGPVAGGVLLDHFWWGSVFLVNVPLMALVLVAGALVLPESRNPRPGRLDWPSVPLSVAGMLGVIYAVKTFARNGVDASSAWASLAVGAAALALFLRRQARLPQPLLDLALFRRTAFSGALASNVLTMFTASTLSLACSLYFQDVRGWSPLTAGLALLPGPLSAAFAAPASGALIARVGRARTVSLGLVLLAVSTAGIGFAGVHTPYLELVPLLVVNGMGVIFTFAVTSDTILAGVPRGRAGAAAAISETGMELGGALGVAVLGSVLNAVYRGSLSLPAGLGHSQAAAARESVTGAVAAGQALPGAAGRDLVAAARRAYVESLHTTLYAASAIMLVGAVMVLFTLRGVPAVLDPADLDDADETAGMVAPSRPAAPVPAPAAGDARR